MTTPYSTSDPGLSREAIALYRYILLRRGGVLRIRTLLKRIKVDDPSVIHDAISDLAEIYWIRITYREPPPDPATATAGPLDHIERLTLTRYGRRKYKAWSWG